MRPLLALLLLAPGAAVACETVETTEGLEFRCAVPRPEVSLVVGREIIETRSGLPEAPELLPRITAALERPPLVETSGR